MPNEKPRKFPALKRFFNIVAVTNTNQDTWCRTLFNFFPFFNDRFSEAFSLFHIISTHLIASSAPIRSHVSKQRAAAYKIFTCSTWIWFIFQMRISFPYIFRVNVAKLRCHVGHFLPIFISPYHELEKSKWEIWKSFIKRLVWCQSPAVWGIQSYGTTSMREGTSW